MELIGSRQSPGSRTLRPWALNWGPFPPPALPGFTGTTNPSATPSGPACPSRASGWVTPPPPGVSSVAFALPVQTCRRPYPGGTTGGYRVAPLETCDGGLPHTFAGSAPTFPVSRPARRSLTLRPACSRSRPRRPFAPEASAGSLPPLPLRLLPAGATYAGWELHPLKNDAFHGAQRWKENSRNCV